MEAVMTYYIINSVRSINIATSPEISPGVFSSGKICIPTSVLTPKVESVKELQ